MSALVFSIFISLVGPGADAQPATKERKPISVSYESVIRCYPELEDQTLSFKVDLNRLRERMDLILVTDRKRLEKRVVKYKDDGGITRRVKMEEKTDPKKPLLGQQLFIEWETVNDNGTSTPWLNPPMTKAKPTQADVNSILARGIVESDERVDVDTKLKGVMMKVRRSLQKVVELRLEDGPNKKVLTCEDRAEFGSICICTKPPPPATPAPPSAPAKPATK